MHKYHIQDREDYHKCVVGEDDQIRELSRWSCWSLALRSVTDIGRYNKLCGNLRSLIHRISLLPAQDPFRQQKEAEMLNKLYDLGILGEFEGATYERCASVG
jgi:hypothetical protein